MLQLGCDGRPGEGCGPRLLSTRSAEGCLRQEGDALCVWYTYILPVFQGLLKVAAVSFGQPLVARPRDQPNSWPPGLQVTAAASRRSRLASRQSPEVPEPLRHQAAATPPPLHRPCLLQEEARGRLIGPGLALEAPCAAQQQ